MFLAWLAACAVVELEDTLVPTITIVSPAEQTFDPAGQVSFCAFVRDDEALGRLEIGLASNVDGDLTPAGGFSLCRGGNTGADLLLSDGPHVLTLTATDSSGNSASEDLALTPRQGADTGDS